MAFAASFKIRWVQFLYYDDNSLILLTLHNKRFIFLSILFGLYCKVAFFAYLEGWRSSQWRMFSGKLRKSLLKWLKNTSLHLHYGSIELNLKLLMMVVN